MSRRHARMAAALAGALVLLGAIFAVAPTRLPPPAPEPLPPLSVTSPAGPLGQQGAPDAYQEVVEGNILSPSRRAPEPRPALPFGSPTAGGAAERPRRPLRLSGIVRGPDGIVALIDADPTIPGAELYRLGDRVGPYRLVEATDSLIVLRGASGAQVLRLDPLPGRIP
jgi:hypothetical protein